MRGVGAVLFSDLSANDKLEVMTQHEMHHNSSSTSHFLASMGPMTWQETFGICEMTNPPGVHPEGYSI